MSLTSAADSIHSAQEKAEDPLQERLGRQAVVQELQELEPGPAVLMESVSVRETVIRSQSGLSGRKWQAQESVQFKAFKTVWKAAQGLFLHEKGSGQLWRTKTKNILPLLICGQGGPSLGTRIMAPFYRREPMTCFNSYDFSFFPVLS